ncbi:MAG TPA: thioredoxin family protein [Acidobacteriota bacterium]|nr:thioredoxin family protein [Acidobacteriota bacterium]HQO18989.1 thioredoxin family protein [Acidobacteriota bacterium]HQQ45882.1 thioredoxin family protein [Acidobacteriota bacterium]
MKKTVFLFFLVLTASVLLNAAIPPYGRERDPFKDLAEAKKTAAADGKRILMFVGGPWCKWCVILDNFLKNDPELAVLLEKNYVVLKIYAESDLTPNGLFMAKFPSPDGYPHLYVLSEKGELLISQRTDVLEKGQSYDKVKVKDFLLKNAVKK